MIVYFCLSMSCLMMKGEIPEQFIAQFQSLLEESFLRLVDGSFGASLVLGYVKLLEWYGIMNRCLPVYAAWLF